MSKRIKTLAERLIGKFEVGDKNACWPWLAGYDGKGYGAFAMPIGGKYKPRRAHRIVYEFFGNVIPEGLMLDHLCKNPACVNPNHLEPVSQYVNTIRACGPGTKPREYRPTHCKKGHPLSGDNLIVRQTSGYMQCRICVKARDDGRDRKAERHALLLKRASTTIPCATN